MAVIRKQYFTCELHVSCLLKYYYTGYSKLSIVYCQHIVYAFIVAGMHAYSVLID